MHELKCFIFFANLALKMDGDAMREDFENAVSHARQNLLFRHRIDICLERFDVTACVKLLSSKELDDFSVGNHLRGIADYLIKHGTAVDYKQYRVGNRLLYYVSEKTIQKIENTIRGDLTVGDVLNDILPELFKRKEHCLIERAKSLGNEIHSYICFAKPTIFMTDHFDAMCKDLEDAVRHVRRSLLYRYNTDIELEKIERFGFFVKLTNPDGFADDFSIGRHLRGLSWYLLNKGTAMNYREYCDGTRLLYCYPVGEF